jgi:O-antigen/teichoic acid export membrane protein
MNKANELIQWTGTAFVLVMYAIMNLAPELAPWNLVAGLLGSMCYFVWTIRVRNRPQLIINIVAMTLCVLGLARHYN